MSAKLDTPSEVGLNICLTQRYHRQSDRPEKDIRDPLRTFGMYERSRLIAAINSR